MSVTGWFATAGGAGRFRGGLAIERKWRLLAGESTLSIRSDRRDHRPYGLSGGEPGAPSLSERAGADGVEILPTMISTSIRNGDSVYHRLAGGGGWGDPLTRDPAAVARDVRNDKVSSGRARQDYGVVLDGAGQVDRLATDKLRQHLRSRAREESSE